MTLRRRIALAVAVAVAAVVAAMGISSYVATRSNLRAEIDQALVERAAPFLRPRDGGPAGPDGSDGGRPRHEAPGAPAFGGAPGYFQFVQADGTVVAGDAGTPKLPVDDRVRAVAQTGAGRYFRDVTVDGTRLRVLTAGDPVDREAVQVARPLTEVDSVLHDLLVTYLAFGAAGILLAAALGGLVGRTALAPISRFTTRTEAVAGAPDTSLRLEGGDAEELQRLAASFNRTLDALERSVEAQRHLVADASHELRTPIAALRSNVQVFLRADELPTGEREALQHDIIAELDELTQLVSDVVELARDARASEEIEELELAQIVAECVERTRRRAPGLDFHVELEPTLITSAPERVTRAVTNVLDNARKWSPPDGRVDVVLAGGTLSVRDHGPGFDDADLPFVFDRFYRAAGARRMPGSGLGLAIVRQAAEAQGGSAQAGNAPGGGALVRVRFTQPS
jgi:two-component system sensor histidine kinase MprB